MIEVQNLNVVFGQGRNEVHAVQDVSFRVEAGESYGLVGESGSGKSTVLRAILRLTDHWTGHHPYRGQGVGPQTRPQNRSPVADGISGPVRLLAPASHD